MMHHSSSQTTAMTVLLASPLRRAFFLSAIIFIAAVGFFASDIYLPSLPAIGREFQSPISQVQLTVSVFLVVMAIFQVVMGVLSDRFGRKRILFFAMLLYVIASYLCFASTSLSELILYRILQAVGACAGLTIGQSIIADLFDEKTTAQMLSIVIPLVAFSPAVAPILGGYMEELWGWPSVFLFLAGYGVVVIALLFSPLIPSMPRAGCCGGEKSTGSTTSQEEGEKAKVHLDAAECWRLLTDKRFLAYASFMMSSNMIYFAFLAITPFLFQLWGYSPTQVGYAFCLASFPYILGSFIARRLVLSHPPLRVIFYGLSLSVLGILFFFLCAIVNWHHFLAVLLPVCVMCTGSGFVMPYSSAGAIALSPAHVGFITGALGSLQLCAAGISTALIGVIADGTLFPLAIQNMSTVLVALIIFLGVFGRQVFVRSEEAAPFND